MEDKRELISKLKNDILRLEGFMPPKGRQEPLGLGEIEQAFPSGVFPVGCVHEFIVGCREDAAASCGFIGGLLAHLMAKGGACLWIGTAKVLYPTAVRAFGVNQPDRILFVRMNREKDVLWALEEALKCSGISAVVAELYGLDFMQSRRLQLAVEKSRVTGFVLRHGARTADATACTARWQIKPVPSNLEPGMPGVGLPRWEVKLLKLRNGNPGRWQLEWTADGFAPLARPKRFAAKLRVARNIG